MLDGQTITRLTNLKWRGSTWQPDIDRYKVENFIDVDGDGKADVLLRDQVDGSLRVALLDGAEIKYISGLRMNGEILQQSLSRFTVAP